MLAATARGTICGLCGRGCVWPRLLSEVPDFAADLIDQMTNCNRISLRAIEGKVINVKRFQFQ